MKVIIEHLTIRLINGIINNQLLLVEILSEHSAFAKGHEPLKIQGRDMSSKTIFRCCSCNISVLITVVDNNNYPAGICLFKVNSKDTRTTLMTSFWCLFIVNQ